MLFVAYAVFLLVTAWAFALIGSGRTPRAEGSPWRAVALVISLASLLIFLTFIPQQEGASLGTLLVGSGVLGSALFAIGAANWTGTTAFWFRAFGWLLTTIAYAIPSTLTLAMPFIAVLAFALVPISKYAVEEKHPRRVAA